MVDMVNRFQDETHFWNIKVITFLPDNHLRILDHEYSANV